ncbi:hypothetical protein IGI04_036435 [Brassica rapa subsp. trilocularis]|uniref:Uncharacterized protein n=1 Tax=Brassica rapa subsp. trilocularis TaxID=1813537 RepID=A0ABQ7LG98_BRACM|nr:hypothetical protein IGI04_036435 [Brassica rapa subsp. trilocularis]
MAELQFFPQLKFIPLSLSLFIRRFLIRRFQAFSESLRQAERQEVEAQHLWKKQKFIFEHAADVLRRRSKLKESDVSKETYTKFQNLESRLAELKSKLKVRDRIIIMLLISSISYIPRSVSL